MSALSCQLTGIDPMGKNGKCLGYDKNTGKLGYVESGGLYGFTSSMIGQMFVMPVQTVDYVRYIAGNFGIAKPSYAANAGGWGFSQLEPVTKLWSVFRNIVYVAFILILLIIGVAIMFRVKIDPRTVMTLQNQLPKIIIGVILVTFSLGIAGLLIDIMYASTYLAVGIFDQADPDHKIISENIGLNLVGSNNPVTALDYAFKDVPTNSLNNESGIGGISHAAANSIAGYLGGVFNNEPGRIIVGIVSGFLGLSIGGASGIPLVGLVTGALAGIFGAINAEAVVTTVVSYVGFLVIAIAILASLFRLWFQLILAYVSILIDIVFAPIWIVAGLIPGSKINFSSWLRNLTANLAAFPAVVVMFLLARTFLSEFNGTSSAFAPPLVGNPGTADQIGSLIALGIIIATPNVVKLMKQIFGAPQGGFGPVFEGLSAGLAIVSTPGRAIGSRLFGEDRQGRARVGRRFLGVGFGTSARTVTQSRASRFVGSRVGGNTRLGRWIQGRREAFRQRPLEQPATAAPGAGAASQNTQQQAAPAAGGDTNNEGGGTTT